MTSHSPTTRRAQPPLTPGSASGSPPASQLANAAGEDPGYAPPPYCAPAIIFRTALEAVAANCYGDFGKAELTDCVVGNS